ncbi:Ig-like domain-containing protein [Rhodococcus gannanensis]|uniref:Ig-like domain-containing protein n=1 Tax=Rhodococcus gannanensis TaxID=1960308 RepID=A0ABW4NXX7_9NOCA
MSEHTIRRVVGGVSAFAVAAGFAVVAGAGVAGAGPVSVNWNDGDTKFTRTLSESDLGVGDLVTSTTKFERTGVVEYIYEVTDAHPACWTFVSATVDGGARGLDSSGADWAKIKGSITQWPVYNSGGLINPKSRTFAFTYRVGADCARNTPLMTSMSYYNGSLGDGSYPNKGPTATVRTSTSSTTLAGVASATVGQAVTLSASVTGGANGDTVEFYDGATKIGTGTVNNGTATFQWTPTAGGAHALTAKYLGNASTGGSTSAAQNVTVAVPDAATTTTVTGPATVEVGQAVTLTAQVSPTPGGGTVQFKDGATDLGAPAAVGADGKAVLSVPSLGAGAHEITAVYSGIAGFTGSTSAPFTVTASVADQATTTALTAPATADEGQAVTLIARVSPAPAGGTVQFKNGNADLGAPVAVAPNGSASVTETLPVGAHQITAVFSGAPGFVGSVSEARTVTVSPVVVPDKSTTTTLTVPATARTGEPVHLFASVAGSDLAAIGSVGTVEFVVGGQALPPVSVVDGVADLTHTFASAGTVSVQAAFSGGPGFAGSSAPGASVTVSDPDPTDAATTTAVTAPATAVRGNQVTLTATVSPTPAGGTVQFFDGTTRIGLPVAVTGGTATRTYAIPTSGNHEITAVYSGAPGHLGSTSAVATVAVTEPPVDPGTGGTGSVDNIFGS